MHAARTCAQYGFNFSFFIACLCLYALYNDSISSHDFRRLISTRERINQQRVKEQRVKQLRLERRKHERGGLEIEKVKQFHRPSIFTFYTDEQGKQMRKWDADWNLSWFKAGWKPIVLSLQDARAHKSFEELTSMLEPLKLGRLQNYRFYRWAAMAHVVREEGGWMSAIDVFPLHIIPEDGLDLPNGGSFTFHEDIQSSLMSGSKSEWERMLLYIIQFLREHRFKYEFSYDLILETMKMRKGDAFQENHVSRGYFNTVVGDVDCSKYSSNVKAVHFSSASSKDAFLGGWLESNLREQYGKGIHLVFKHKDNSIIYQDPKTRLYTNKKVSELKQIDVIVDGKSIGTVSDVLTVLHRTENANLFMERVKSQCSI